MGIFESIMASLRNVYSHKMRSTLTMLGIIIGIGSVIMISSVGAGVKNAIFSTLESINKRVIQVMTQTSYEWDDLLNYSDAEAIKKINTVENVTMMSEWYGMEVKLRTGDVKSGGIVGTDANYNILEKVEIARGRFLTDVDIENHSNVAVLSTQNAYKIFGYLDCIGDTFEITSWNSIETFTVIGVLAGNVEPGVLDSMMNTPLKRSLAVIPITTINDMFGYEDKVDFFGVTVVGEVPTIDVAKSITGLLDIRHESQDAYYAQSMEGDFDMIDTILSAITAFIAFVAAISLFVGGVGVMNIMLVTVKERTREIGIRKSLGATDGDIKFQFVLESITLSILGGAIGIGLGFLLASVAGSFISAAMDMAVIPVVSPVNVGIAFGVSMLVGLVFGVYPAGKAAKLDPIEALRYE